VAPVPPDNANCKKQSSSLSRSPVPPAIVLIPNLYQPASSVALVISRVLDSDASCDCMYKYANGEDTAEAMMSKNGHKTWPVASSSSMNSSVAEG
jgi:hypothetical protein